MKTKEIQQATQDTHDGHAIFRIKSRWGSNYARLLTDAELPTVKWNLPNDYRNIGKPGFVAVVRVVPVDAEGKPQGYEDWTFECAAVIDIVTGGEQPNKITEVIPVGHVLAHINDRGSAVDYFNTLNEIRGEANRKAKIEATNRALAREAHEARVAEIRTRAKTYFNSACVVSDRHDGARIDISSDHLLELIVAAEAAKAAGLVK